MLRRSALLALALAVACGGSVTDAPRIAMVELSPSTASVRTGGTVPLTAQARDADGRAVAIGSIFWSSSDTAIATVSSSGVVTARTAGSITIAASTAGASGTAAVTVSDRDVASVQLTPAALELRVGATGALQARPLDAQGGLLAGRSVVWTTSNFAVATVSTAGVVTARAVGTATVTATSEGRSGAAVVTVTSVPVASVVLTPSRDTLNAGASVQLVAVARDAGGATLTGRTVTWSSADTRIATVTSAGLVVAVAPGSTAITATSEGRSATSTIVVLARPVASVNVTPASNNVVVGSSVQLTAQLTDVQGTVLSGRQLSWTSSNGAVASVDASGLVRALSTGNVTITATSEGRSGSATVVVGAIPVSRIDVTPAATQIFAGATVQLNAVPRAANGDALSGRNVTWRTGASSVATVSASGLVTGVGPGTAVITAEVEGVTGSSTVTVSIPPVASITITPASSTISPLGSVQLVATLRDAAGNTLSGRTIVWTTSNESVAFVSSGGRVVGGLFPGTATITATSEGVSGTALITVR